MDSNSNNDVSYGVPLVGLAARGIPHLDCEAPDLYLGLSGGGFRATARHIGTILCLLRHDCLKSIRVITGVSGGAIATAWLAKWWADQRSLTTRPLGVEALRSFLKPICAFMQRGIRRQILLRWLLACACPYPYRRSPLEVVLDNELLQGFRMHECPLPTTFVIQTTDVGQRAPLYLSNRGCSYSPLDLWRSIASPDAASLDNSLPMARAVAASAAFPALCSPVRIKARLRDPHTAAAVNGTLRCTDGGVMDNLGVEFLTEIVAVQRNSTLHIEDDSRDRLSKVMGLKAALCFDAGRVVPLDKSAAERHGPRTGLGVIYNAGLSWLYDRVNTVASASFVGACERHGIHAALVDWRYLSPSPVDVASVRHNWPTDSMEYMLMNELTELIGDDGPSVSALSRHMQSMRTDFDSFSDTELFALILSGYTGAMSALRKAGYLGRFSEPDSQTEPWRSGCFECVHQFTDGILSPIPACDWITYLGLSKSRFKERARIRAAARSRRSGLAQSMSPIELISLRDENGKLKMHIDHIADMKL
ncbi:MAG: patatin-like phospholipase family protein [Phycisphaerales bacterium]